MSEIFESMGIEFAKILVPMLDWITKEGVGPGLAATIIAAGIIFLVVILVAGIKDVSLIQEALRVLKKEGSSQRDFSKNYNIINENFLKINKVKHVWSEYTETLILPKRSEDGIISPCSNTERPHDFFNIHDLNMGPSFTKVLPSIFIAVGLSLTFLGLISALSSAVEGMEAAAGDTQSIQRSISGLLNAASAKFYASLSALFMSILLTLVIKLISSKLEKQIKNLNKKIESGLHHLTLESLGIERNTIMNDQLVQLKTFNTDLAMKIGEQVQASLEKTFDPLVKKLGDMGDDINKSNMKNLENITGEVIKGIQGAAGESMDRVANTLDAVSDKLGGLTDILSGALSTFDSDFKNILNGLKSSLEESTQSVAEGVGKTMVDMNKGISESTSTATKLIADLAGTIETLSQSGEEIASRGGEALRASVSAAAEAAGESMTRAGQELSDGFKESTADLVNSFTIMNGQVAALDNSLTSMSDKLVTINDKLAESSESIKDASVQFRAVGGGLKSVIEPLSNFAIETRGLMQELTESLETSSKDVALASDTIKDSVERIRDEVTQQIAELSGSDEHLANLLEGIESSTERVLQSVNSYVNDIDKGFANSIGQLDHTIGELQETIDQFSEAQNDRQV